MAQNTRRFDATWLPFGMMIGVAVGIGTGMVILDNLFAGAIAGILLGAAIGIALGSAPRRRGRSAEEVEDEAIRQQERAASGPEHEPHQARSRGEHSSTTGQPTDDTRHGDGPHADTPPDDESGTRRGR